MVETTKLYLCGCVNKVYTFSNKLYKPIIHCFLYSSPSAYLFLMLPPTVEEAIGSIHSTSYFSDIPSTLLEAEPNDPIIMGVDEAGRGPVLGPMVYATAFCRKSYQDSVIIPNYSFDDSKKLTDPIRRQLFSKMYGDTRELDQVGYSTTVITPLDISTGMNRFPPTKQYNLNEQAHDVTMALIQGVLDRGVRLSHVYIDTVGPPLSYQKKLQERFPNVSFTVEKKADSLYCMVSVASVVAKVTRDLLVESLGYENIGSGYPSDPNTKKWLRDMQSPLMGWPQNVVRFSWQTAKTLLEENARTGSGVNIQWEDDFVNTKKSLQKQWEREAEKRKRLEHELPITLDNWYH